MKKIVLWGGDSKCYFSMQQLLILDLKHELNNYSAAAFFQKVWWQKMFYLSNIFLKFRFKETQRNAGNKSNKIDIWLVLIPKILFERIN